MTDIKRLRELEAKATKAPWATSETRPVSGMWAGMSRVHCTDPFHSSGQQYPDGGSTRSFTDVVCGVSGDSEISIANRELIAELRNALPALLDELEAARKEIERLNREDAEWDTAHARGFKDADKGVLFADCKEETENAAVGWACGWLERAWQKRCEEAERSRDEWKRKAKSVTETWLAVAAERDAARKVVEAAQGLVRQLQVVNDSPEYQGVWVTAQAHIGCYNGPTYIQERVTLDAALSAHAAARSEVPNGDV